MQVKILIRSTPENTQYARYHGLSIDEPLDHSFWSTEPQKIVITKRDAWYEFFYRDLPEGEHYLVFGNSDDGSMKWSTNIAVNDSLLAEEVIVDKYNQLTVNFYIGELPPQPPPPKKFNWWWLLLILTAVIEGIVYSQSERKEEENWRKERW